MIECLRIDGGMAANDWLAQFLADILALPVDRPVNVETTAQGAAILAALGAGIVASIDEALTLWQLDRRFDPCLKPDQRSELLAGWNTALNRAFTE